MAPSPTGESIILYAIYFCAIFFNLMCLIPFPEFAYTQTPGKLGLAGIYGDSLAS